MRAVTPSNVQVLNITTSIPKCQTSCSIGTFRKQSNLKLFLESSYMFILSYWSPFLNNIVIDLLDLTHMPFNLQYNLLC